MATKDGPKKELKRTKSHLRSSEAELEALREQVHKLEGSADAVENGNGGVTKRDVMHAAWVAPVILSVNLPNAVFAQSALSPVSTPAPDAPTRAPTTSAPTTSAPTTSAPTTSAPTLSPTMSAPTKAPTKAPTDAPTDAPFDGPAQSPTVTPTD
jgi:hypothetical protein